MVCMMMNIRFKSVGQEDYHQPLGALLGMEDVPLKEAKADNAPMAEEMLARSAIILNRRKKKNAGSRPKIKNNSVKSKNP